MTTEAERKAVLDFLALARKHGVSERGACELLDLDRRTIQNWRKYGPTDRRKGSVRFVPHRLTDEERRQFLKEANSPRFADKTPDHLVAVLAQEKRYIASTSTLYRILREEKALAHRRESMSSPMINFRNSPI